MWGTKNILITFHDVAMWMYRIHNMMGVTWFFIITDGLYMFRVSYFAGMSCLSNVTSDAILKGKFVYPIQ